MKSGRKGCHTMATYRTTDGGGRGILNFEMGILNIERGIG